MGQVMKEETFNDLVLWILTGFVFCFYFHIVAWIAFMVVHAPSIAIRSMKNYVVGFFIIYQRNSYSLLVLIIAFASLILQSGLILFRLKEYLNHFEDLPMFFSLIISATMPSRRRYFKRLNFAKYFLAVCLTSIMLSPVRMPKELQWISYALTPPLLHLCIIRYCNFSKEAHVHALFIVEDCSIIASILTARSLQLRNDPLKLAYLHCLGVLLGMPLCCK